MLGKKRNASVFVPQGDETDMVDSKRFEITPMEEITAQAPMIFAEPEGFENCSMDMAGATRAHALFFAPENEGKDFSTVLAQVQEYISEHYSTDRKSTRLNSSHL